VAGATYPYYRFMNATPALMALVGLGAWVAVRWLNRDRAGVAKVAGILASLLIIGSLGYVWVQGREAAQWADPGNQWIDQPTRTTLAASRAVVEHSPEDAPVIFILNFGDTYQSYGWAKTFTNVSRTGLPGDAVKRSMSYFGDVNDFLAGQPTQLTDETYNKMARGFARESAALERRYAGPADRLPRAAVQREHGQRGPARPRPAPDFLVPISATSRSSPDGLATPSPEPSAPQRPPRPRPPTCARTTRASSGTSGTTCG
jgi:hypothetical protein